jgi:hypothetical protein
MKGLYALLLSFLLLTGSSSCKKAALNTIDFTEITFTDSIYCGIIGEPDTSDWATDTAAWSAKENALLNFSDDLVIIDSVAGTINISAACPNPNDGHFRIIINTERECKMKIACVNTEMETLYFAANKLTAGANTAEFDFGALTAFHKNMYYRMYYAFYNSKDSLYYKGHGDFLIQ